MAALEVFTGQHTLDRTTTVPGRAIYGGQVTELGEAPGDHVIVVAWGRLVCLGIKVKVKVKSL